MNTSAAQSSFEDFAAHFTQHGGTDLNYLRTHYARYLSTQARLLAHWRPADGLRVLDVGAHWLHQALLYALESFKVTALDVPATFDRLEVQALARAHGIELLRNQDLEQADALMSIADDTFDLILFTEIIEHLTFNPIAMWRELYRVMRPGAHIVLTTPNYYGLRRLLRAAARFLRGDGGSVQVDNLLRQPDFAHHWKEYSARELSRYFQALSPDFTLTQFAYVGKYEPSATHPPLDALLRGVEGLLPPLRPNLYLEIALTQKNSRIAIEPHW